MGNSIRNGHIPSDRLFVCPSLVGRPTLVVVFLLRFASGLSGWAKRGDRCRLGGGHKLVAGGERCRLSWVKSTLVPGWKEWST